jgi:hypothetical protein
MNSGAERRLFEELPQALVEQMLAKSADIGDSVVKSFREVKKKKKEIRIQLRRAELLTSDVYYPSKVPTTCGVDGAFAVEQLLSLDLVACAAVAVEGLAPPQEEAHWEGPHHLVFFSETGHSLDNGTILKGLMAKMEVVLASSAPHDVVFLDGSFTSPLIAMNQAVNKVIQRDKKEEITDQVCDQFGEFLESYTSILQAEKGIWASIPKYTSKKELSSLFNWSVGYDDRAMLTTILEPGELIAPIKLATPDQPWHLKSQTVFHEVADQIYKALDDLYVIYYRPSSKVPALRVEISSSIASDEERMALLLKGLQYQCVGPVIIEPFPLYLADRKVKHLSTGVSTIRHASTRQMAEMHEAEMHEKDMETIFFLMHNYRTD